MSQEHKYDLVSLPLAFFWQLSIPMLLIIRQWRASVVAGGILTVSLVGLYFFWHRHLPPR
jgi:hypothetical protein